MSLPENFADLTTEQGDRVVKWVGLGNSNPGDRRRRRESQFISVRDVPSRWLEQGCGADGKKFSDRHLHRKNPQSNQLQSAYKALRWELNMGYLVLEGATSVK